MFDAGDVKILFLVLQIFFYFSVCDSVFSVACCSTVCVYIAIILFIYFTFNSAVAVCSLIEIQAEGLVVGWQGMGTDWFFFGSDLSLF